MVTPTPAPGRTFVVHGRIGGGGHGEVYRATMEQEDGVAREVALKTLGDAEDLAYALHAVRRLRDEAATLSALAHPGVPAFHDLAVVGGVLSLVTEYVPGWDVDALLEDGPMPERAALEVVRDVADVLEAARHAPTPDGPLALVHRDIKPSNVRVTPRGGVRLLDFGIARSPVVRRASDTATGMMVGTTAYVAPERLRGEEAVAASDVYGLGCVALELVTGQPLWAADDWTPRRRLRLDADAHDRVVADLIHQAGLSDATARLLTAMLAHRPERRPTAADTVTAAVAARATAPGVTLRTWVRERSPLQTDEQPHARLSGRRLDDTMTTPLPTPARDGASTTAVLVLVLVALLVGMATVMVRDAAPDPRPPSASTSP